SPNRTRTFGSTNSGSSASGEVGKTRRCAGMVVPPCRPDCHTARGECTATPLFVHRHCAARDLDKSRGRRLEKNWTESAQLRRPAFPSHPEVVSRSRANEERFA